MELCLSCGRNTAPGTHLFSSRKRGIDTQMKQEGFLCLTCQAGSATVGVDQNLPVSGRYVVFV